MLLIRLLCCLSFFLAGSALAAEPFMAAPVTSGNLTVQLVPTEAATPGSNRLVTFGVPFPRGSLTQAGLANVRVFKGAVEIPAYVDQLTPWRHRLVPALDGTSVRVARIQIHYTFVSTAAESIRVEWGGAPRQQNVTTLTAVRNGWHTVTSGTYVAADNVQEPDVYAVLDRAWLSLGALKGNQSIAFDGSNTEPRDNPVTNDGIEHWPGFQEADRAAKNNFYNLINQDDPAVTAGNRCPYKTDYEPWLYDRASSLYVTYFRSGFYNALREAVRASEFYTDHVNASGFFDLKNGDTKYVYAENLAYRYWLTGDDTALTRLSAIVSAQAGFNDAWTPTLGFWTERHAAFKLLANQVNYEINGGSTAAGQVSTLVGRMVTHQDGANGQIPRPTGFVDGGLYHYGFQHDGDWADNSLGASSWMSGLIVDAMLRAYSTSEDPAIANFIRRMGNFLRVATINTTDHSYDYSGALALPRYGMLSNGADGQVNFEDVEHALDVAAGTAWADYFAELTQQPDSRLAEVTEDLYFTYDIGVNYWIRPSGPASGLPAYRVTPWRKYGWEHRVSGGLGWAVLGATAQPDAIFSHGFE